MVRYNRMFVYHYCDLKKIPIHRHDAWEIVYYEQGSGITHIGGESYNYDKNTFTVTPKEVLMNEIHHQSTTPWCVMLDVEDFPLQQGIYKDTKDLRIFKQIQKIYKEQADNRDLKQQALDAMCTLLAVEISRMGNEDYEVKNKFSHVISELERNFLEDIDWQELASKTHYSYEHFRHLFKAFYGVSPKQYVRTLRLEHAKRLLSNEKNYTSTYICEICKFSNYNRFRTLFKAETGLSPNQYRKKMQGDFLY